MFTRRLTPPLYHRVDAHSSARASNLEPNMNTH